MLALLFLVAIIGLLIYYYNKIRFVSKSPWQHFFDGVEFSTKEFYDKVEAGVRERKVPEVYFAKESFLESHVFSAKREYLRVTRGEYVFFVCAAPFGTGTFVSEWLCVKKDSFINRIPIINKLAGKDRDDKTFYQMDTEGMCRSAIHSAVVEVLDGITTAKGVRGLSDLEKIYQPRDK